MGKNTYNDRAEFASFFEKLILVGIGVNKLTLKSINIIQSSNNYNIVSSFICWNQNIVHMKILDTSFKIRKEDLDFG